MRTFIVRAALLQVFAVNAAIAQNLVTVRGLAFDSLRGTPLGDAFLAISGGGKTRTASSDARGRFTFDSIVPGRYTLSMQHAAIDSLGLPGLTKPINIGATTSEVTIAIPSFASLWRSACGRTVAPTDSGLVYGVIRDAASQRPVANATVDLSWIDLSVDKDKRVNQRRFRNQTKSDATGTYGVCGVPTGVTLSVRATTDSTASGLIDLVAGEFRVSRRDLQLGSSAATGARRRGTVAGTVTDIAGNPFRDARVRLDEFPEARTGADGRFVIRDVPIGTRQLEIMSIGMTPVLSVVDVAAGDTTRVTAQLRKVSTLAPVRVTATARIREFNRGLEERKRNGFGTVMDSTTIGKVPTLASVFTSIPNSVVQRLRGSQFVVTFPTSVSRCVALVWIDGVKADFERLNSMYPEDIAVIEAYPNRLAVPDRFRDPYNLCGALLVWSKNSLR
jgi:hypothetical protein